MDPGAVRNLIEELIPFVKKTGVVTDELSATKVKLRLPHDPSNLNPMGILHAGATFTLAETCAAALCLMAFGQKVMFIGKAVDIRFKRPGKGDVIAIAQMTPADAQRTSIVIRVARRSTACACPRSHSATSVAGPIGSVATSACAPRRSA